MTQDERGGGKSLYNPRLGFPKPSGMSTVCWGILSWLQGNAVHRGGGAETQPLGVLLGGCINGGFMGRAPSTGGAPGLLRLPPGDALPPSGSARRGAGRG